MNAEGRTGGVCRRLAIVGLGLMGGSLGLAARRRGLAQTVCGYARRPEARERALREGIVDAVFATPEEAVADADLAVFCLPILCIPGMVRQCRAHFAPDCVVTDVGSTKAELIDAVAPALRGTPVVFVGSHPIAGSEAAGLEAARERLYEGAVVIVTPPVPETDRAGAAVERVGALWHGLGARVSLMDAVEHDRMLALTSHLPHLVAALLVETVLGGGAASPEFCGTGFRDATRIAAGSESVWHDIFKTNRRAVSEALEQFEAVLQRARGMLARGDFDALRDRLGADRRLRQAMGEKP